MCYLKCDCCGGKFNLSVLYEKSGQYYCEECYYANEEEDYELQNKDREF